MSDDDRAAEALDVLRRLDETRIETKADLPSAVLDVTGREVTTLFSVDNLDRSGDVTSPKAFNRSIGLGVQRIPHLFMHDDTQPAIARTLSIEPVGRASLPEDVQREYPEATGGVVAVSRFLKTGRGAEVFEGIQEGIAYGASFGFITKKASPHPTIRQANGKPARLLEEVHLVEVTTAQPGAAINLATRSRLHKAYSLIETIKIGRRHSAATLAVINEMLAKLYELGGTYHHSLSMSPDPAEPGTPVRTSVDGLIHDLEVLYTEVTT